MTYNGWKNYETWAVGLWLGNSEASYSLIEEMAVNSDDVHYLARWLKDFIEENNPLRESATMYSDLLNAALSEVDWLELAEHYWQDFREEEEVEE